MRRELKCMELRSQNQRIIEVLGEELSRAQADLQFAWRLACALLSSSPSTSMIRWN